MAGILDKLSLLEVKVDRALEALITEKTRAEALERELSELKTQLSTVAEKSQLLETENNNLKEKAMSGEGLQTEFKQLREKSEQLENTKEVLERKVRSLEETRDLLEKDHFELKAQVQSKSDLLEKSEMLEVRTRELEDENDDYRQRLAAGGGSSPALEEENKALKEQVSLDREKIDSLLVDMERLRGSKASEKGSIERVKDRVSGILKELDNLPEDEDAENIEDEPADIEVESSEGDEPESGVDALIEEFPDGEESELPLEEVASEEDGISGQDAPAASTEVSSLEPSEVEMPHPDEEEGLVMNLPARDFSKKRGRPSKNKEENIQLKAEVEQAKQKHKTARKKALTDAESEIPLFHLDASGNETDFIPMRRKKEIKNDNDLI